MSQSDNSVSPVVAWWYVDCDVCELIADTDFREIYQEIGRWDLNDS